MTTPESTYCDSSVRSTVERSGQSIGATRRGSAARRPATARRRRGSAPGPRHPLAGLELRWKGDLRVGEGLLGLGVLRDEHGRRPLLPVRALAPREADRTVPSFELVCQEGLDQLFAPVALRRVECVSEEDDLSVPVERAVDR